VTLFTRQRLLLTLLDALNAPVGNPDFQALLFLYTQECEKEPSYEFVPHRFGAFSFTVDADKRRLMEAGLLAQDEERWALTESGRKAARQKAVQSLFVDEFGRRYRTLRGDVLLAEQFRRFPYYATRSENLNRVLPDSKSRKFVTEVRSTESKPGLLTIGYEGRSLEAYLNLLIQNSVTLLCDVRRNPFSRKFGFSRSTLSSACEDVGIRYEHLPELGIDADERRGLKTRAEYDGLFAHYERHDLPKQGAVLEKIRGWVKAGERVALTCYEAEAGECHRHCVAEALERLKGVKLTVQHL